MAFDVNIDALFDPMLLDSFVVTRRQETVGTNGRTTSATSNFSAQGVVVAASPDDLQRLESYQVTGRAISITTTFPLRGEITGFQPDSVAWRGSNFIVKTIDYFVQYGKGFYVALATATGKTDEGFTFPQPLAATMNVALNSSLIGAL